MPRMMVCPVSLSSCTLKVGSSSTSLSSASSSFSWSALDSASMADEITGS